jgi:hypothetical protein
MAARYPSRFACRRPLNCNVSGHMIRRFDVYAPLQDFYWPGGDFSFSPNLALKRIDDVPDLSGLESSVSKPEWQRATNSDHWLKFQWVDGAEPSPSEVINLVLLSLWLVKPIRSQVALKFEIGREDAANERTLSRLLDRFAWIPGTIDPDIADQDLRLASTYYSALEPLCRARGRLNNALVLTVAGCWSHGWQTALTCHASAAETILTYATGWGLTRRLGTSYACLVESDSPSRDAAFAEFVSLYSARSDVVHGRMHNIAKTDTLPTLLRFQNLMRRLWSAVLTSKHHVSALELDDPGREAYLTEVQSGYTPPTRTDR